MGFPWECAVPRTCGEHRDYAACLSIVLPINLPRAATYFSSHLTLTLYPGAGAGKSSLVSCLLRLTEVSGGRITVDGRNVAQVPLRRLRSAIGAGAGAGCGWQGVGSTACSMPLPTDFDSSATAGCAVVPCAAIFPLPALCPSGAGMVPQAPFVFHGSLRENLDPCALHSDPDLAAALRQVQLWVPLCALLAGRGQGPGSSGSGSSFLSCSPQQAAAAAAAGLMGPAAPAHVSVNVQPSEGATLAGVLGLQLGEGSLGLSQGQQQLLCLARVLLKRPRLLCLDEYAASVDPATAATMQQVGGGVGWYGSCHVNGNSRGSGGEVPSGVAHGTWVVRKTLAKRRHEHLRYLQVVREQFGGATVVEVAHRLSSVRDCDQVAVMEAGQVRCMAPWEPMRLA